MRRVVVSRAAPRTNAFQLYARNDPKQVPRRNVHIISRPDASKGAGYDFIREPRLLSAFFYLLPPTASFSLLARAREAKGAFSFSPLERGSHGTLLFLLPPFSRSSPLFLLLALSFFDPLLGCILLFLPFSRPRPHSLAARPPRRGATIPPANSHGRITRNPTTLWPVNGSSELLLVRASAD